MPQTKFRLASGAGPGNPAYIQYQTAAEGDLVDAWLTQWEADHGPSGDGILRSGFPNTHSKQTLNPPHAEGCVSQVTLQYHIEVADLDAAETIYREMISQIYAGQQGSADCDSDFGMYSEEDT